MDKVSSYKRNKSEAPEIRIFKGPGVEAQTGDGSYTTLFGSYWAATRLERVLTFYQLESGAWVKRFEEELPLGSRHIAAGFDGSARRVWAYEVNGQIFIRQWENLQNDFVLRGPFPGYDPLILNDAHRFRSTNDSDSLLIHLTSDRLGVITRLERDDYGVANSFATFGAPGVLDQGYFANNALVLLGENEDEEPLFFRSAPYPVNVLEQGRVNVTLLDWPEESTTISRAALDQTLLGVTLQQWQVETISLNRQETDEARLGATLPDWIVTLILVSTQTPIDQARANVTLQPWIAEQTMAAQFAPVDQTLLGVTLQNWTVT
jgi:hypothetical protein